MPLLLVSPSPRVSLSADTSGVLIRLFSVVEKIYHAWFTSPVGGGCSGVY